jgi:hypothetical protein
MQSAALRLSGLNPTAYVREVFNRIRKTERSALAAIVFEMQWFTCFLNLASLPDTFLSLRVAALVARNASRKAAKSRRRQHCSVRPYREATSPDLP